MKFSDELTIEDFLKHPVWEYTNRHECDGQKGELAMEPVDDLPVTTLDGRLIGTEAALANGRMVFVVLIGVDLKTPRPLTSAIVFRDESVFMFRRTAPRVSGPEQLAEFLELRPDEIFPIKY